MIAVTEAQARARHRIAPTLGLDPADAAAACGLAPEVAVALLSAPRIQARVSRWMLGDAPAPSAVPAAAVLASTATLHAAALAAGAALRGAEIARIVRRDERRALADWLPEQARRFAVAARVRWDAPPVGRTGSLRASVEAAAEAAAAAWGASLPAGDRARVALRFPPVATPSERSPSSALAAALFVRAVNEFMASP